MISLFYTLALSANTYLSAPHNQPLPLNEEKPLSHYQKDMALSRRFEVKEIFPEGRDKDSTPLDPSRSIRRALQFNRVGTKA